MPKANRGFHLIHILSAGAARPESIPGDVSRIHFNLDIFILEDLGNGCEADGCIAYGDDTVIFNATAGTTYYLVVDAKFDTTDDFTIDVTCN